MEITKAMLMTGINQFWLYFAGLKSNHIFFNWGGRNKHWIDPEDLISHHCHSDWEGCRSQEGVGSEPTRVPSPGARCLTARHSAADLPDIPTRTATASPSLPPTPARRKARKENPSFHVAGCVLRWLLRVDGAKLEKRTSRGSFTARRELRDVWNDTVGVAMRRIALFWFGVHGSGFCFGGFLLNCDS